MAKRKLMPRNSQKGDSPINVAHNSTVLNSK